MRFYLNPNYINYEEITHGKIFVDHSMLIEYTNEVMRTHEKMLCVSRPRRFGKSTDAYMLAAYYSKGCDSSTLFKNLKISQTKDYTKHLNQYNVLFINMQEFLSNSHTISELIMYLNEELCGELLEVIHSYDQTYQLRKFKPLSRALHKVVELTQKPFVIIIDEWDCILREQKYKLNDQKEYLDFLRDQLKDQSYVALCYMTGILPIKKYGTHSALNMFKEISMLNPMPLEQFMGFTEEEVKELCIKYDMDYDTMKEWYGGYYVKNDCFTFLPASVITSIKEKSYQNYRINLERYERLQNYIEMDIVGLRDDIISLLAGHHVNVNTSCFQNDMTTFNSKDDVLTLLIHLGYLGYDNFEHFSYIPNKEVIHSFMNSKKI